MKIDTVKEFRIFVEGLGKWIKFVDRDLEVQQLRSLASKGYAFPIALYGPEGCGKTTLLQLFIEAMKREEDCIGLYIDALEVRDFSRAIISTVHGIWDVVESLAIDIPIGRSIARCITYVLRKIHEKVSLRDKRIVIALDDVYKAIGLEEVDRYTKMLYEWIGYLHREFEVGRVLFILATSEGTSKRIL